MRRYRAYSPRIVWEPLYFAKFCMDIARQRIKPCLFCKKRQVLFHELFKIRIKLLIIHLNEIIISNRMTIMLGRGQKNALSSGCLRFLTKKWFVVVFVSCIIHGILHRVGLCSNSPCCSKRVSLYAGWAYTMVGLYTDFYGI